VHLEAEGALVGQIVPVRIVQAHRGSLSGQLAGAETVGDRVLA
jgi:hypothetical protein